MLTVLIATHNGAKTLPIVLGEYCKQTLPKTEWKLAIVDNGSTDNTKEVIDKFVPLLPVMYLVETRRGKNVALNSGLAHIEGDLVLFTDDDVLPHENWLKELRTEADSRPFHSIFGGPILPAWESPPQDWILSWVPLKPAFGILDDQEEGDKDGKGATVFGANMAVRSNIFKMGYRFDETVGPNGSNYAMGSETDLLLRLRKKGFKSWHCKNAIVKHMIRSSQMEKQWILNRAIRYGRGIYRAGLVEPELKLCIWGMPVRLYLEILNKVIRLGAANLSRNAEGIFTQRWHLNAFFGMATEARNIRKITIAK
jgi:glycosyltransferase involved in cell wall biosynthesis